MSIRTQSLQYTPLDRSRRSIRLIVILPGSPHAAIRCHIKTVDLEAGPAYSAISYTWGNKCKTSLVLWINGQPCGVRPSLWAMLQALRDPVQPLTCWIDAFCIDLAVAFPTRGWGRR